MTFDQGQLTSLRESRGWTRKELAVRVVEEAQRSRSFVRCTVESLERMIRRWENGTPPMSAEYRRLFQRVFDGSEPLPPLPEEVIPVPAGLVRNSAPAVVATREAGLPSPACAHLEPADPATSDDGFAQDVREFLELMAERAMKSGLDPFLTPGGDVALMAATERILGRVRQHGNGDETPGRDAVYGIRPGLDYPAEERTLPWEQWRMCHRLVVLGDAGMGKSWLLRLEAKRLAEEAGPAWYGTPDAEVPAPVPVLIRANVLAASPGATLAQAVSGYLVREGLLQARSQARMENLIADGHAVLMIDGLDEAAREEPAGETQAPRKRLDDLLARWAERCSGTARFVVTSRLAGYLPLPIRDIREAALLPFTRSDINDVMTKWKLIKPAEEWVREQLRFSAVAKMAQAPLLLALICALAGDVRQRRRPLPRSRTLLYEELVWKFMSGEHRTSEHGAPAPALDETGREQLLRILAGVAFRFADAPQGWSEHMPYRDLAAAVSDAGGVPGGPCGSPGEIIDHLARRVGILAPAGHPADGKQGYVFLHRTFAEYFVARYLHDLDAPERLEIVTKHQWFEPDWAVVMPMLGGLLDKSNLAEAASLVAYFLNQRDDPLHWASCMAIRILGETSDPDRLLTSAQMHSLRGLVTASAGANELIVALAEVGIWPRLVNECIFRLSAQPAQRADRIRKAEGGMLADYYGRDRAAAIVALARRAGHDVSDALLEMLVNGDGRARWSAVEALARRAGRDVTDGLLRRLADDDEPVRWPAVEALARRAGRDVTDGLLWMLVNGDGRARWSAVVALQGCAGRDVTDGLLWMLVNGDGRARWSAVVALRGRAGHDVTDGLLRRLADDDEPVRWAAVSALACRAGRDVTDGLLRRLADDDESVCMAAIVALACRAGRDVTDSLLGILACDDSFARWAAVVALAARSGRDVTDGLHGRLTDENLFVREAATQALARREWDGQDVAEVGRA